MAAPAPLKSKTPVTGPALIPLGHHEGKPPIALLRPVIVIGSRSSARIHLVSHTVSKAHALLIRSNGRSYIRDLASRTKLIINEDETREADLEDGDIVKIGSFVFKYVASADEKRLPRDPSAGAAAPSKLEISGEQYPYPIDERVLLIGRRAACDVHLLEETVSTAHAVLFELNGQRVIRDLGSRTGTFVNGVATHQHQLSAGDRIRIGETEMRYVPNEVAPAVVIEEDASAGSRVGLLDRAFQSMPVEPMSPAPKSEPPAIPAPPVPPTLDLAVEAEPEVVEPVAQKAWFDSIEPPVATPEIPAADAPAELAPLEPDDVPFAVEPAPEAPLAPAVSATPVAPPVDDEQPIELDLDTTEPQLTSTSGSADIADVARALSVEPQSPAESSSAAKTEAEEQVEPALEKLAPGEDSPAQTVEAETVAPQAPGTEGEASEAELPRRGWRGLSEPVELSPLDAAYVQESTELESKPADPVLKFPDSISQTDDSTLDAGGETSGTAVLDAEALAADALAAPGGAEADHTDLGLDAGALEELLAPPPAAPVADDRRALDLSRLEQSEPAVEAAAEIVEPVAPLAPPAEDAATIVPPDLQPAPQTVLDLSMDAAKPADVVEPSVEADVLALPPVEATPAEESARPLIANVELPEATAEPLPEIEPIKTTAIPLKKPRRTRRGKSKPETIEPLIPLDPQPDALPAPVAEDAIATPVEIVIEPTEPTTESALQSSADQLALDALSAPDLPTPPVDVLTDATFERNVREFTGNEFGEIVEDPQSTSIDLPEPLAPTALPDVAVVEAPVAELAAPEAPDLPPPAELAPVPEAPIVETTIPEIEVDQTFSAPVERAPVAEVNVPEVEVDQTISAPVPDVPIQATTAPDAPLMEPAPESVAPAPITDAAPVEQARASVLDPTAAPVPDAPIAEGAASVAPKAQIPWGANQDNFLGGVPLNLKTPAPAAHSQTPIGDKAVKELIDEIDSVSAKADAATSKPGDGPGTMGIIPPRPRKPGVFRATGRRRRDEMAPELTAAEPAAPPKLTTSFDALVDSPLREMDVFSQMSPPGADEADEEDGQEAVESATEAANDGRPRRPRGTLAGAFGAPTAQGAVVTEEQSESELARRQKVVPEIPETVEGMVVGARRPSVTYAAELTEAETRAIRRKYFRRACALVVLMFLFIAGAGYGVYNYFGVQSTVEASIRFKNLELLSQRDRAPMQDLQIRTLKQDSTRVMALRTLNENFPWISPGFLENQKSYFTTFSSRERAGFSDTNPDVLLISVQGSNAEADRQRLAAIAHAIHNHNSLLIGDAEKARKNADEIKRVIAEDTRQVELLTAEIIKRRTFGESVPTREQIKQLETDVAALEQKWNESVAAVKAAEAELERMKSAPVVPQGATTAPAGSPADDARLKQMQTELDGLLAKVSEAQSASAAQAATARRILDAALEAFQKQVTDAQGMMNGNPELTAFIQSAQTLLERTRTHTEGLINRQQQQFARLMELKQRMNEQMEARRIEIWKKDEKIQEYRSRLDMLERQYNAAVGGGMQKEAEEKKSEIDLIKNMIRAREEDLPVDSFYKEAIGQLQVIVDSTKKDIEEDRTKTEQLLTTLQTSFTSKQTIEKLPEEQKQLATELQQKLDQINAARKQYNEAVDNSAADVDARLKTQVTALQTAIEARRKELADANVQNLQGQQEQERLVAIGQKQNELNKLQAEQTEAQTAYFEKHKQLRSALVRIDEAKDNSDRLDALLRKKDEVDRVLKANLGRQEDIQRAADRAVEPLKPDAKNDIRVLPGNDRRLLYAGVSCGGILVVFCMLILWTLHSASVEAPANTIQAADLRPLPEGQTNGKSNGGDEDHQPAAV